MLNKRNVFLLLLALVVFAGLLFAAATFRLAPLSAVEPTPTTVTPAAGMGALRGVLQDASAVWQQQDVYAYAAAFTGDASGEGIYIFDAGTDPQSKLESDGLFQINNMPPGPYVLVIGPSPTQSVVIRDGPKPRIIQVPADQVVDIGTVDTGLPTPSPYPYP